MSRALASVVVPTWNGRDWIEACLSSLFAQDLPDLEVVVVDNASTDGTPEFVATSFPQAVLIRNRRNLGFAGGCNAGCRVARGEVLAFLNQDAVVDPNWLRNLIRDLEDPGVGIAGSKCLFPDRRTIQMAGGRILWPLGVVAVEGQYERDQAQEDEARQVEFVSGCGMAFSRRLLDEIGYLDEAFWPGYYEDVDFCFRATNAGYSCRYVPLAKLFHAEGSAFRRWSSIWRFHHRGRLHFVLKQTAPVDVLEHFLPTERLFQPFVLSTVPRSMLGRAYVETVRRSIPALCESGHFEPEQASAIADGLLALARLALDQTSKEPPPDQGSDNYSKECLGAALELSREQNRVSLRYFRHELGRLHGIDDSADLSRRHIEQLELMLQAREGEIASTKALLRAREEELASIKPVLQARLGELASIKPMLEAREEELASIKSLLRAREEELASIKPVLQAREEELASIKPVLRAREEELASTRTALQASERELHEFRVSLLGRIQAYLRRAYRSS